MFTARCVDIPQQLKKDVQASEDEKQSLVAELRTNLSDAELQVQKYGSQMDRLEKDLLSAQEYIEQQREVNAKCQQLSLELERERGRLAGMFRTINQSVVFISDNITTSQRAQLMGAA